MSKKDRKQLQTLAEAYNKLPERKREYLIGYAEGVIAAHEGDAVKQTDEAARAARNSA